MEDYERARIEALCRGDPVLEGLWEQHLSFERQLEEFDRRPHLTPGEALQRKQMQKRKLAGKDRIARILARHSA